MIVVDTNIWIDHLRTTDPHLVQLIRNRNVVVHPYVIAEVGLGSLQHRKGVIENLETLPGAALASHEEVMALIELNDLAGTGIGYVDCHLLAAALLSGGRVWTRDKRLAAQATRLAIRHEEPVGS